MLQSSAMMAFNILTRMGMAPLEIAKVIGAIGNHDEEQGYLLTHWLPH